MITCSDTHAIGASTVQTLERGYWPSYNVPSFPEVYNRSGYPEFADKLRRRSNYNEVVTGKQVAPQPCKPEQDALGDVVRLVVVVVACWQLCLSCSCCLLYNTGIVSKIVALVEAACMN